MFVATGIGARRQIAFDPAEQRRDVWRDPGRWLEARRLRRRRLVDYCEAGLDGGAVAGERPRRLLPP